VLLLVGFGLTWAWATVSLAAVDNATKDVALSGRDLLPAAAASGWIALAGLAGLVATRSWGRSIVAVIVLIAGLAGSAAAIAFAARPSGFIASLTPSAMASVAPGWLVALIGGVCTIVAAAWALARGRRWPSMGARYHRATPESARSTWDLQDMGQDPTRDLVE
jgi:hypothetical protein